MKLRTKGRFAVTAMIDVALRQHDGPVTLAGISERQKMSLSYLEQLFGKLRHRNYVQSVRGPGGGYIIVKSLDDISIAEIIHAVDEPLDATNCQGMRNCQDDKKCMTHDLWETLSKKMHEYLSSVSLADVARQNQPKGEVITLNKVDPPMRRYKKNSLQVEDAAV